MQIEQLNADAFASGQIGSKLWLCQELEKIFPEKDPKIIWMLGGWYGVLAQLLFVRENLAIECIRSFDIDPNCEKIADLLNENWVWQEWKFKAKTIDCNQLVYEGGEISASRDPDIIVCTAAEHFSSDQWWQNIPTGKFVIIQANDMPHEEHLFQIHHEDELLERFPLKAVCYKGQRFFNYNNDSSFHRFMIMGYK